MDNRKDKLYAGISARLAKLKTLPEAEERDYKETEDHNNHSSSDKRNDKCFIPTDLHNLFQTLAHNDGP